MLSILAPYTLGLSLFCNLPEFLYCLIKSAAVTDVGTGSDGAAVAATGGEAGRDGVGEKAGRRQALLVPRPSQPPINYHPRVPLCPINCLCAKTIIRVVPVSVNLIMLN